MKESDHSSGSYTDLRFIYRYSTLCIRARPLAPVRKTKICRYQHVLFNSQLDSEKYTAMH